MKLTPKQKVGMATAVMALVAGIMYLVSAFILLISVLKLSNNGNSFLVGASVLMIIFAIAAIVLGIMLTFKHTKLVHVVTMMIMFMLLAVVQIIALAMNGFDVVSLVALIIGLIALTLNTIYVFFKRTQADPI